jgi:capsular polysaccharide export protein
MDVSSNPALLQLARARHVLLLQGPVGAFFDRLALWLTARDVRVSRVAFQAGDVYDSRVLTPLRYTGSLKDWPAYLKQLVAWQSVDCIVLFGQSRAYHVRAIRLARELGLTVVVLEEGYFRPGYITMELDGVNGYSSTLSRFRWAADLPETAIVQVKPPKTTRGQYGQMARYAMGHYWAMYLGQRNFPFYQHHRAQSVWYYSRYWVTSFIKKWWHYHRDHATVASLADKPYFFVPIQHDGDAQITHHSSYGENTAFISEVLVSFADHAPRDAKLVFRQHPFSRGGAGHSALIHRQARALGIDQRVISLVEGHTPTLVKRAQGVVLINSTVGLQALSYRRPLKVMGEAMYDGPGLSFQGALDDFWCQAQAPDEEVVGTFLDQMRNLTQAPCNVYGLRDEPLRWEIRPEPEAAVRTGT